MSMSAPESLTKKRWTVINTRADVANQLRRAQETGAKIIFEVESETSGTPARFTLEYGALLPWDDKVEFSVRTESLLDASIIIPLDPQAPAIVEIPE